jgi:hypothetical protein
MKLICLLSLILSSVSFSAQAQSKMYKLKYVVEQNDNLNRIIGRFVYPNSVITKNTPMTQKTFEENSHVKNWNALVPGTLLDLYIDQEYLDVEKYKKYNEQLERSLARLNSGAYETENAIGKHVPTGLKSSLFYLASYGRFTQSYPQDVEFEFYQNSPITLGSSFSYYPKDSLWSFTGSAYFSYLLATSNNLNDADVDVPAEIGLNFYPEYRFVKYNFTGYFGLDYEKFSTFNIGGLENATQEILLDQNSVIYGTIGVSKLINVFNTPFFTKLSFSHSLSSTISPNSKGSQDSTPYTGYKFLWYVNRKFNNRLYLHTLFKYHKMNGPSELTTLRLGLGFGFILQ